MSYRPRMKTALLYGEGGKEVTFFNFLLRTEKFKFLEKVWSIDTDHASGESCEVILKSCILRKNDDRMYDLVLCFIDVDKLIHDFPKDHVKKEQELEVLAASEEIIIVWQDLDHEGELYKATAGKIVKKGGMKRRLKLHQAAILRSDYVKAIFQYFHPT